MNLLRMSEGRSRQGIAGLLAAIMLVATGSLFAAPKAAQKGTERKAKTPAAAKAPAKAEPSAAPRGPVNDDLYEGPVTKPVKPVVVPKTGAGNQIAAPLSAGPKFADAWPSEYRRAEADLELTSDAEHRSEAIAEFVRGQLADEKGDAEQALEAWKRASALDPANGELAVKVAFELAKRNEPGEAIRILKDSIAVAPKEPRTHVYLAQVYAKHLNKPDLALQAAQRAVEAEPDYFPAWIALYELHEQAGDKKKSAEVIEKAQKSETKKPDYWLQMGAFLAKAFLRENETVSPEELRRMETAYRKAAEFSPNDASVLAQTGDFFAMAGNDAQSLEFYERAIKLNQPPNHPATKNLKEKYAEKLQKNGRLAEAITLFEEIVRDPQAGVNHELFERLGELYQQAGQMDKAIDHYKQSLVLDASEPRNHLYLANAQIKAKKFAEAVATMEMARQKFPDRPQVSYFLANALSRAKRHQDALAVFAKMSEEVRGRDESLLDGDFYFQWGATAEQAGDLEKAATLMKKAIELDPNSPEPYNYLGYMWVDKGINLEEAGALIKKAIEIEPKNGAYLDSLGWYYFKTGKFDEARRELLAALDSLEEEDPVVFEHLADTYEQLGNLKEAISFWEKALKLEPANADKLREKVAAVKKRLGV